MIIDACCTIGLNAAREHSPDALLAQMDSASVDMSVLHPADKFYAWENEKGNDLLLKTTQQYPNRFIATATVNPWRSDAVSVINKYIDAGAKMLSFSPGVQGFILSEDKLDSILESVAGRAVKIPIYVHTGHHSCSAPSQLSLLARRFGQLDFIMGHSGSTDYGSDVVMVCQLNENIYPESSCIH